MGCEAQRKKVFGARPLVCVFGHYHCSYGVEKVIWNDGDGTDDGSNGVKYRENLTDNTSDGHYDFTNLRPGEETVFINAAWMTMEKHNVEKRNKPVVIDLQYPSRST